MYDVIECADAALGDDLANGKDWQKVNRKRRIVMICLCGGAAALDAGVDVFFGQEQVMHLDNGSTGVPDKTKMRWHTSSLYCPANTAISIKATKNFSATATYLAVDIKNA